MNSYKKHELAPNKNQLAWFQIRDYEFIPTKNLSFLLAYEIIPLIHGMNSWVGTCNHGLWVLFQPATWKCIFHGMIQNCEVAVKFWIISWHDGMNSYDEKHL